MPCLGLTSFLPCPLWEPVFMRVSAPVFAGIFQNILKNNQNKGQKWARARLYLFMYNPQRHSIHMIIPEIKAEATPTGQSALWSVTDMKWPYEYNNL